MQVVSDQAPKAGGLVDEAMDAGLDGSSPLTVHAKMLRLELPSDRPLGLGASDRLRDTGHIGSPPHITSL